VVGKNLNPEVYDRRSELTPEPSPSAVKEAVRDLHNRTLNRLNGEFARLVYLASTRNYNSGRYEHDGLTFRFSSSVAERALAEAHREVFLSLALSPLKTLFLELERYIQSESAGPEDLLAAWSDLETYRILVPLHDDPVTVKIFISNVRAALAIARASSRKDLVPGQPGAWRSPSPDR
jgi:hypothetical protein